MSNVVQINSFTFGKELETLKQEAEEKLEQLIAKSFVKSEFIEEVKQQVRNLKSVIYTSKSRRWFTKQGGVELKIYNDEKFLEKLKLYIKQNFSVNFEMEIDGQELFLLLKM
jgi:hypothetical protein